MFYTDLIFGFWEILVLQGEPAQAFTKLFLVLICNKADIIWEKEMATHSSILAWRIDRGGWWAAVYGVAQSRTRLEKLSSSSRDHLEYENIEQWYLYLQKYTTTFW